MKKIILLSSLLLSCSMLNAQQPAKTKTAAITVTPITEAEAVKVPGMRDGASCTYVRKKGQNPFFVVALDGATIKVNNKIVPLKRTKTKHVYIGGGYEVKLNTTHLDAEDGYEMKGDIRIKNKTGATVKIQVWGMCDA